MKRHITIVMLEEPRKHQNKKNNSIGIKADTKYNIKDIQIIVRGGKWGDKTNTTVVQSRQSTNMKKSKSKTRIIKFIFLATDSLHCSVNNRPIPGLAINLAINIISFPDINEAQNNL